MATAVALAAASIDSGWGKTRMRWIGWDDSVWEISDPAQKRLTQILTTYLDSKNLFTNPQFAPDGSTVTTRANYALDPSFENFTPASVTTRTNLWQPPNAEATTGTVTTRTNIAPNPFAVSTGTGMWGQFTGTGGAVTGAYQTGQSGWSSGCTTSYRCTWTTGTTFVNGGINAGSNGTAYLPVTAGRTYGALIQARCSKQQRIAASIVFYDATNTQVGAEVLSTAQVLAANTVGTFVVSGALAPAGAVKAIVYTASRVGTSGVNWAAGDWLEATHVHFEETLEILDRVGAGPANGTFQGSTAAATWGADFTYAWSGAANGSSSLQKAPALTGITSSGTIHRSTMVPAIGSSTGPGVMRFLIGQADAGAAYEVRGATGVNGSPVVAGKTYTGSFYARREIAAPGRLLACRVFWYKADGSVSTVLAQEATGPLDFSQNTWARYSGTFTAPSDAAFASFRFYQYAGSTVAGDVLYIDSWMFEEGSQVLPHFDGSSAPNMLNMNALWQNPNVGNAAPVPTTNGWIAHVKQAGGSSILRSQMDGTTYPRANFTDRPFTFSIDVRNTGTVAANFGMDFSDVNLGSLSGVTVQPGEQKRVSVTSILAAAGPAYFADIVQGDASNPWVTGAQLEYRNPRVTLGDADLGSDFTYAWTGAANTTTSTQKADGYTQGVTGSYDGTSGLGAMNTYSSQAWSANGAGRSVALAPNGAGNVDTYIQLLSVTGASNAGLLGKWVTVSGTVQQDAPMLQAAPDGRARRIVCYVTAPSLVGGVMQSYQSAQMANVAGSQRLSASFFLPADTTYFSPRLYSGSGDRRDIVRWDDVMVEVGDTLGTYFSGATAAGGDFTYNWVSTPNASYSQQKALAVPGWQGSGGIFHLSTAVPPPSWAPNARVGRFVLNHGTVNGGPNQQNARAIPNTLTTLSAWVYQPTATGTTANAPTRLAGWSAEPGYPVQQYSTARDGWNQMWMTIRVPNSVTPLYPAYFHNGAPAGSSREIFVVLPQLEATGDNQYPTDWVDDSKTRVDTPQPPTPVIESGVFLANEGVRGLSMPPITRYTSSAPAVAGSRYRGVRTEEREAFWPLMIASDESAEIFREREKAFFKTLRPGKVGTWEVTPFGGETRRLKLRFKDDGDATYDRDPNFFGTAAYGITLAAEQPYWQGDDVVKQWSNATGTPMFAGPGVINIAPQQTSGTATMDNPGDVDGWIIWTLQGSFTDALVGVGASTIQVPFPVASDRKLVIDTRPDRLTAYEYASTDADLTGAFVDRTDELGTTAFAPLAAGVGSTVSVTLNGAGGGSFIEARITPLYYRAW